MHSVKGNATPPEEAPILFLTDRELAAVANGGATPHQSGALFSTIVYPPPKKLGS